MNNRIVRPWHYNRDNNEFVEFIALHQNFGQFMSRGNLYASRDPNSADRNYLARTYAAGRPVFPGDRSPARTTIAVAALPLGACVEIDLVVKA
jgi:hypothetical protein